MWTSETFWQKIRRLSKTEHAGTVSAALVEKFSWKPLTSCEEFILIIFHIYFLFKNILFIGKLILYIFCLFENKRFNLWPGSTLQQYSIFLFYFHILYNVTINCWFTKVLNTQQANLHFASCSHSVPTMNRGAYRTVIFVYRYTPSQKSQYLLRVL